MVLQTMYIFYYWIFHWPAEGRLFTWGWGGSYGTFSEVGHSSAGQLGQGSDVDYINPARVCFGEEVKALQISCGFNHTGAILEYT